jgi:hypothetical protein
MGKNENEIWNVEIRIGTVNYWIWTFERHITIQIYSFLQGYLFFFVLFLEGYYVMKFILV